MKRVLHQIRKIRHKLAGKLRQRKEARRHGHGKRVGRFTRQIKFLKHLRDKYRRQRVRMETAHREGVDWAYGNISPEALKNAGKDFIIRYVSSDPSKCLSASEARIYSQAGIDMALVFEDQAGAARGGYSQGEHDARYAHELARKIGMPDGRPIYLAVDFDAASEGVDVRPYFRGAAAAVGRDRVGIYAGLHTLQQVANDDIVDWYWQTYAWSHHQWDERAHIRQVLIYLPENPIKIAGVPVDYNKSRKIDFGQWKVS